MTGRSGGQNGRGLHSSRCLGPAAPAENRPGMRADSAPARFLWLPPGLRPPVAMVWRQERVFLLVGAAALIAGYDLNVYGLAIPQIQASFQIPENQVALIVANFRMAAFVAMLICASADLVGRRRLLLVTILGQAIATLAASFAGN